MTDIEIEKLDVEYVSGCLSPYLLRYVIMCMCQCTLVSLADSLVVARGTKYTSAVNSGDGSEKVYKDLSRRLEENWQ